MGKNTVLNASFLRKTVLYLTIASEKQVMGCGII